MPLLPPKTTKNPAKFHDINYHLTPQPACESVPISEKGDDGVTVESSLRVPQHLSITFLTDADAYCSAASAIAPYSLPTNFKVKLELQ